MRSEDRVTPKDVSKPPERIAHELGNLLAVTIGQSEYLLHEDGRETLEERRESLESVRRAALEAREKVRRLHRLIRDGGTTTPRDPGAQAWQALFSAALGALLPGENLDIRLGKEENAVVLDVSGPASALDAIVAAAPGPVDLGERPGGERTVTLRFPVADGVVPLRPPVGQASGSSVLVIDDQEEVRESLAELLRQLGYRVGTAASGAEGIESYRRERVECVVTDMAMPGLSGLTVCRVIKDHDPEAYVVLLTGAEYDGDPEELRAAGVDRLLVKPLTRAEVLGLVERSGGPGTGARIGAAVQERHE